MIMVRDAWTTKRLGTIIFRVRNAWKQLCGAAYACRGVLLRKENGEYMPRVSQTCNKNTTQRIYTKLMSRNLPACYDTLNNNMPLTE